MDFADFHFETTWLAFAGLRWTELRRRRGLAAFAAERLLARLTAGYSATRRLTKDVALALSAALLLAALAGPRWGRETTEAKTAAEDVVFVLDVSKSMLVADMRPNRLARAKASIGNFIRRKGTGSVGLVAFSGSGFLQCPLTRDYDAFFRTLEETDTTSIQVPGTDVGRALDEAELAFAPNRNRKLVIILTDGEDLEAGGVDTAKKLARQGLVVHTVGVGTPAGGTITVINDVGAADTLKSGGEEVLSRLGQAGEGMEALRLAIQAGTDATGSARRGVPREEWFLALALLLLVAESLLSTRRPTAP